MGKDGKREGEKEEPMKERMGGMKSENEVYLIEKIKLFTCVCKNIC